MYLQFLKESKFYIILFCVSVGEILAEVPKLAGVSLSRVSLYDTEREFTCFDGSLSIPFTQVNDDYCDCLDASDEPGTSACPNGIFHCINAGHKPLNIVSSRVNDGVCDCCDGSDEYAGSTSKNCVNNCLELGQTAREEALRLVEIIKEGKQLRAELSDKGIWLKQEKKAKLIEFKKYREEAEQVKKEKEIIKNEAEELESIVLERYRKIEEDEKNKKEEEELAKNKLEAIKMFNLLDSNQDGKIEISELQTKKIFDKDKSGEVSEEEATYFLNGENSVNEEFFLNDAWSNIKPYLMVDAGLFKPPFRESEEKVKDDEKETKDHNIEVENDEEVDDHDIDEPGITSEENSPPIYDEETQKLIQKATAARNEFNEADRSLQEIITEIKNIEEYLEKDFGLDEEFATLEGQCFEYTDHEYVYKLCPFDKTIQKPKSTSLETRLGVWSKWIGTDDTKYDLMLYDKGQSCWNGPQRSTHVRISCGSENKLTSVSEPNRCEYLFEFMTPAACRESQIDNLNDIHDEL